jgi:hypothetical protein
VLGIAEFWVKRMSGNQFYNSQILDREEKMKNG